MAAWKRSGIKRENATGYGFRPGCRKTERLAECAAKIFRQQVPALRDAVYELSQGRTETGFDKLDKLGQLRKSLIGMHG
jgi:hypothetical protein